MLSRVADSLYWMSRYLERAEHTARLLDVSLQQLDQRPGDAQRRWERLLAGLQSTVADAGPLAITASLTFDAGRGESIVASISAARENARQVREQISSEMWEQINRLYLHVRSATMASIADEPHGFFRSVKEGAHLFQGICDATMSHGEGWHFIQAGRAIERASATTRMLEAYVLDRGGTLTQSNDDQAWVCLLKSCTAYEAYCKVYTATIRPERIVEFLVLDAYFPHSMRFAAETIQIATRAIAAATGTQQAGRVDRLAGRLRATLDYGQTDEILADLRSYLATLLQLCAQLDAAIYQTYIAYPADQALSA
jgi:uncharacterized alpha-E superfamily protein